MKRYGPILILSAALILAGCGTAAPTPGSSAAAPTGSSLPEDPSPASYELDLPDDHFSDTNVLLMGTDPASGKDVIYDLTPTQKNRALRLLEALELHVLRADELAAPARSVDDITISIGPARFIVFATPIGEGSTYTGRSYIACIRSDREIERAYVSKVNAVRALDELLHFKKQKTMTWEEAFPPDKDQ